MDMAPSTGDKDIREGIARLIPTKGCAECDDAIPDMIIEYLKSQGVVRKVKCPHCSWSEFKSGEHVGMTPCFNCNSTGYTLVEEL